MSQFNIDIKFIDASDWQELAWYNSGGTRAKKVLQDPEGNEYYFKCSEKKSAKDGKPEKHYKYEFWSEIIAYQLGKNLGLDVLRYDPAIFKDEIGCISPKMTVSDEEQLLEIGRFMTALNPDFIPEDYKTRNQYDFQLLEAAFDHFKFNHNHNWNFIFNTLLFDSIIGNTDRHQENWAFIGNIKTQSFTNHIWQSLYISKTAPIYDSGSSMARELTDERVDVLLSSENELRKYVENGKSELHWYNKKISHYELISNLLDTPYRENVIKSAIFLQSWHPDLIEQILDYLDEKLPDQWKSYCMPINRKKLIIKLVTLRLSRLNNLISDGI